ncbi:MAG: GNAT family N-acetyltransferase [Brachybacterium sp.]|nr:GNAT family N-acetyltransferase [Brachybacterium sp.]
MQIHVRPLDATSESDLLQLNALDEACDRALFGGAEVLTIAQRRALLEDTDYWVNHRFVAEVEMMDGGRSIVGLGAVQLPQQENTDTAFLGIGVHPAFRGRGVATALVEEALLPTFRASGRSLITTWGEIPADGDPDDPELPWNRVAARLGASRKNLGVCRTLALPLETALLDELWAEVAEKIAGYSIISWEDAVPERYIVQYGALLRQLELDEPDEDVEYDAPEYTPERIRVMEERRRSTGKRAIVAIAVAPDGTFAGNSEVEFQTAAGTTVGWQENTLVMPEHRGHRLGLALKVTTHRRLAAEAPGLTSLVTWNSHVNPWMIQVNEKLGYEIAFREITYQGRPHAAVR